MRFGKKNISQARVVADTNTIISGLLWNGAPRYVLDYARADKIVLFTSKALLAELETVLQREKFLSRLELAGTTPRELLIGYASLAVIVEPDEIKQIIIADPDDNEVLACAVKAKAEIIVSGDGHLLELSEYQGIRILKSSDFISQIGTNMRLQ